MAIPAATIFSAPGQFAVRHFAVDRENDPAFDQRVVQDFEGNLRTRDSLPLDSDNLRSGALGKKNPPDPCCSRRQIRVNGRPAQHFLIKERIKAARRQIGAPSPNIQCQSDHSADNWEPPPDWHRLHRMLPKIGGSEIFFRRAC